MYTHPFNPVFFLLLAGKSPETFPKHKEYFFISESFALNFFFCFKHLPLNIKQKSEFLNHLIDGERLLSVNSGKSSKFFG